MSAMRGFATVLTIVAALSVSAQAITFTGTLSTADGSLVGNSAWATGSSLSYTVSRGSADAFWSYHYSWVVPHKEPSHLILEVSHGENPFSMDNLLWSSHSVQANDIRWYGPAHPGNAGNPGLVNNFYGLKIEFDDLDEDGPYTIEFALHSDREPMWGDFYAKDGKYQGQDVYQYNAGLGVEALPFAALGQYVDNQTRLPLAQFDGLSVALPALSMHLLVPNSVSSSVGQPPHVIPEPLTLVGLMLGGTGVAGYYRRRRLAV